ncbi:MAG: hypothetical protein EBV06_01815 [Planctomycetia bacterium]|nr:hypothetical protein [Planctomycetia bacterium]
MSLTGNTTHRIGLEMLGPVVDRYDSNGLFDCDSNQRAGKNPSAPYTKTETADVSAGKLT